MQYTWPAASYDPVVGAAEAVSNSDNTVMGMWPVRKQVKILRPFSGSVFPFESQDSEYCYFQSLLCFVYIGGQLVG